VLLKRLDRAAPQSSHPFVFIVIAATREATSRKAQALVPFVTLSIKLIKERINIFFACWLNLLVPYARGAGAIQQNYIVNNAKFLRVAVTKSPPPDYLVDEI
jgi:hypothetical protein